VTFNLFNKFKNKKIIGMKNNLFKDQLVKSKKSNIIPISSVNGRFYNQFDTKINRLEQEYSSL
jgi:hypothetical protein